MIENFLRPPRRPADYTADAIRAIGVISVIVAAIWWAPTDAGILAFALPALFAPRFLGTRAWFDILFGTIVLIAAWSNVLDLYRTIIGWDLVVHFACTGVISAMVYLGLARFAVAPRQRTPAFTSRVALVLAPTIGLAMSALWEMVEWAGHRYISDAIFVTYTDTIGDMAFGGLGALAAGVLLARVPLERSES